MTKRDKALEKQMNCATRAAGAVGVGLLAGVVTLGTVGAPAAAAAPVKAGRMVAAPPTVTLRTGPSIALRERDGSGQRASPGGS